MKATFFVQFAAVDTDLTFFAKCSIVKKTEVSMEKRIFTLTRIEGEYAYLAEQSGGEELFIALALLPAGVDVGTVLEYENFEFSISE